MSKMSELDLTMKMVIDAGEVYVAAMKKATEAAEKILSETKALMDLCTEKTQAKAKEIPVAPEETGKEEVYTFDEVRALLSGLSGKGKFQEIKELFSQFGVSRLSAIAPKDYPELVKKAKEIAND